MPRIRQSAAVFTTEIWPAVRDITGWMTEGQGRMLSQAARMVPDDEAIVEIGSHHGRSTIVLSKSKAPGVQVTAVDPFDDPRWGGGSESLAIFEENLRRAGVADQVELFRGFGEAAARSWTGRPVGLLYVDGAHDFPTVEREINAWVPHLSPRARVLFHDTFSSPGVTRAVLSTVGIWKDFSYSGRSRSLAMFERVPALSAPARVAKLARLALEAPYFARNLCVKIAMRRNRPALVRLLGHTEPTSPY